ncbi:MAG: sel1 repeat family protein [Proteobacteria bacterium]|nr:sel1 repeat family protein [Pseudomonadota bacterium]
MNNIIDLSLKKALLSTIFICLWDVSWSNIPAENNLYGGTTKIILKTMLKNCNEEYTDKKEFRICSINKIVGLTQLAPHVQAIKNNSDNNKRINKCLAELNLSSRLLHYTKAEACLTNIHGKKLKLKKQEDFHTNLINTASAQELLDLGEQFFYGYKTEHSLEYAAQLFIAAQKKGAKDAMNNLLMMIYYLNSNKNVLINKTDKGVYNKIFDNVSYSLKNQATNNGDAKVAYIFGLKADDEEDYQTAIKWYELATKQNHHAAINNLAVIYAKGKGVKKDTEKAIELYTKAAELGNYYAQHTLGNRYAKGRGVKQNITKSIFYYQLSAKQGHSKAAFELAEIYRKGKLIKQNYAKALKNYLIVATGNKANYKKKPKALSWIGYFYEKGYGVQKDFNEAKIWYSKAAYLEDAYSQRKLGYLYQFGKGVNKDLVKSFNWYLKAGTQGNLYAQQQLGFIYRNGRGVEKDLQQAYIWFEKAAKKGKEKSMYALANLLWNGQGVAQNKILASSWYHQSAEKGYALAQYWLGEIYARGDSVKQDMTIACEWTKKASDNDNKAANINYNKFCK